MERAATILVADDEPLVAEMYSVGLERAGYSVLIAGDGREALRLALSKKPDLIFLDVRMPAMGGIEVLEQLMAIRATRLIPVVMLSNYDDPVIVKRALDLGAREYLLKAGTMPADVPLVAGRWLKRVAGEESRTQEEAR